MPERWRRRRTGAALMVALLCNASCTARLVVNEIPFVPPPVEEQPHASAQAETQGPVLAIDVVRLFVDGSEYSPAEWVVRAVVESMKQSGAFVRVIDPADAELAPEGCVRATVKITDDYDQHEPFSVLWFILSFMAGSLPTMLIPIESDLVQLLAVDFALPSGEPLTYRLTTSVTRKMYLVYVIYRDHYPRVLRTNLEALTKRLQQEPALRRMRSPIVEDE